jgi:short-subunit dehydrogenase
MSPPPQPATDPAFFDRYGPCAVVLGASEGLGAAFARALADRGLDLVLVARRPDALEAVAAPLRARVDVRTEALDLADPDLAARLEQLAGSRDVGLCVYNAALSRIGPFLDVPLADKQRIVDVNCRGPLIAADVFGRRLVQRGRGGLLLMSSLTAFWGSPLVATYGATKAFGLSLGEALWYELGPRGVDVLVCCAGATRTPGFERASGPDGPRAMAADAVADEALRALGGPPSMVPGRLNRLAALVLGRLFPRRRAVALMGSQTARLSTPRG